MKRKGFKKISWNLWAGTLALGLVSASASAGQSGGDQASIDTNARLSRIEASIEKLETRLPAPGTLAPADDVPPGSAQQSGPQQDMTLEEARSAFRGWSAGMDSRGAWVNGNVFQACVKQADDWAGGDENKMFSIHQVVMPGGVIGLQIHDPGKIIRDCQAKHKTNNCDASPELSCVSLINLGRGAVVPLSPNQHATVKVVYRDHNIPQRDEFNQFVQQDFEPGALVHESVYEVKARENEHELKRLSAEVRSEQTVISKCTRTEDQLQNREGKIEELRSQVARLNALEAAQGKSPTKVDFTRLENDGQLWLKVYASEIKMASRQKSQDEIEALHDKILDWSSDHPEYNKYVATLLVQDAEALVNLPNAGEDNFNEASGYIDDALGLDGISEKGRENLLLTQIALKEGIVDTAATQDGYQFGAKGTLPRYLASDAKAKDFNNYAKGLLKDEGCDRGQGQKLAWHMNGNDDDTTPSNPFCDQLESALDNAQTDLTSSFQSGYSNGSNDARRKAMQQQQRLMQQQQRMMQQQSAMMGGTSPMYGNGVNYGIQNGAMGAPNMAMPQMPATLPYAGSPTGH